MNLMVDVSIFKLESLNFLPPRGIVLMSFTFDFKVINKRNDKRFNNRGYSLFLLRGIFLKHLTFQLPEVFCKKGVLKNLRYFTGEHLCWSLFYIKLQAIRSTTLLKRDSSKCVFL